MTTNETVTVKPLAEIAAEWIRKAQELMAENADLHTLVNTQAAIIAAKNDEIAQMRGDYAGALVDDAVLTGDVLLSIALDWFAKRAVGG